MLKIGELELAVNSMKKATVLKFQARGDLFIAFDTETTGLSAFPVEDGKGHQILSIYCRVLQRTGETKTTHEFERFVRMEPSRFAWSPTAFAANGLDKEKMLSSDHSTWEQVTLKLLEWVTSLKDELGAKTVTMVSYSSRHFDTFFVARGFQLARIERPSWLGFSDALCVLDALRDPRMRTLPVNPKTGRLIKKQVTVFEHFTGFKVDPSCLHVAKGDTLLLSGILYCLDNSSDFHAYSFEDRNNRGMRSYYGVFAAFRTQNQPTNGPDLVPGEI